MPTYAAEDSETIGRRLEELRRERVAMLGCNCAQDVDGLTGAILYTRPSEGCPAHGGSGVITFDTRPSIYTPEELATVRRWYQAQLDKAAVAAREGYRYTPQEMDPA